MRPAEVYPRLSVGRFATRCLTFANGADRLAGKLSWWKSEWPTTPCDDGALYTSRVGTFKANGFGLFDMIGNVSEWVQDCYEDDYDDAPSDGTAVNGGCKYHVVRGGSWGEGLQIGCGLLLVTGKALDSSGHNFGFRIAREL